VREEGETMRRGWREVKESQMRKCGRDSVKGEKRGRRGGERKEIDAEGEESERGERQ
jgi:hypothetical protein